MIVKPRLPGRASVLAQAVGQTCVARTPPGGRSPRPWALMAAAALLAGCANSPLGLPSAVGADSASQPAAQSVPSGTGSQGARTAAAVASARLLNTPAARRAVLASGTVTGVELLDLMQQMRVDIYQQRSAKSMMVATQAVNQIGNSLLSGGNPVEMAQQAAVEALLTALVNQAKSYAMSTAYKALDDHLSNLLGGSLRAALAAESVKVPGPNGLDDAGVRRVLNMAAMVLFVRLTSNVLDQADATFKSLEVDYKGLLEQREQAASVLFEVVDRRKKALQSGNAGERRTAETQMLGSLTPQDLAYIDNTMNTMTLTEFRQDMAAQNLALRYLRSVNPDAAKSYETLKNSTLTRTDAYVKAVAGVAAFGALSVSFLTSYTEHVKQRKLVGLIETVGLAQELARRSIPLLQKTGSVTLQGVNMPELGSTRPLFSVAVNDSPKPAKDAKAVFDALQSLNAQDMFKGVLFRNDAAGWLNGVRRCDAAEAGRMLDASVPAGERARFASDYFGAAASNLDGEYSFLNAFTAPSLGDLESKLADDMLTADQRQRYANGERGRLISQVQLKVDQGYGAWSNHQLLRLIFANREGAAAYATMTLGNVAVRPAPTPESVYVYESYVNSCITQDRPAKADAPPKQVKPPEPPKPAPTPRRPTTGGTGTGTGTGSGTRSPAAK